MYMEFDELGAKMADSLSDDQKAPTMSEEQNKIDTTTVGNTVIEGKEETIPPICSPMVSKPFLAPSHFGKSYPGVARSADRNSPPNNAFAPKNVNSPTKNINSPAKSILKPATLPSTGSFKLRPSSLKPTTSLLTNQDGRKDEVTSDSDIKNNSAANGESPKFVPLLQSEKLESEKTAPSTATQPIQTNFVFGQNLEERVIADECRASTSCTNSNGTSNLLFGSAIRENSSSEVVNSTPSKEGKSLSESAREYEESRAIKRKYDEVEVITGEEGETNIIHISCKLFSYDSTSLSWLERGRGNLRLNDREVTEEEHTFSQSRLVFRTSGSLRVLINTKIWADMMVQKAGPKSIRLTAVDSNGEVKVFLIMASIDDTDRLHKLLQERVKSEQINSKHKRPNVENQ